MIFRADVTQFRLVGEAHGLTANDFRGAIGALLHDDAELYPKFFDPRWTDGPSGYQSAPRPFVLRYRPSELELITFREGLHSSFAQALTRIVPMGITSSKTVTLPLREQEWSGTVTMQFATPTALKCAGGIAREPHFKILIQRLSERVQALGRLYQNWPPKLDFSVALQTADEVQTIRYDWHPETSGKRRSARSGHSHDLRGYVGWAEYEGPVGAFVPLLEIGCYTGVGRNTVWGNGELRIIESSAQIGERAT